MTATHSRRDPAAPPRPRNGTEAVPYSAYPQGASERPAARNLTRKQNAPQSFVPVLPIDRIIQGYQYRRPLARNESSVWTARRAAAMSVTFHTTPGKQGTAMRRVAADGGRSSAY